MTTLLDPSTDLQGDASAVQERARQAFRESATAGTPLSRQALGDMFGRSASWARDRIAEVRQTDDSATDNPTGTVGDKSPIETTASGAGIDGTAAAVSPAPDDDTPDMTPSAPDMAPTATPVVNHHGARFMARLGFAIGSLVSVAGNWLAAWLPAAVMPPGWAPSLPSQIGAGVWPVVLLVSIEVLARTSWKPGWYWVLIRVLGGGVVALGSGVISYGHIHEVLLSWGYDRLGAGVGPLVIDGLMVVSGFALLSMSTATRKG